MEDQALPAVLRWPHLLSLQLPRGRCCGTFAEHSESGQADANTRLCLLNSTAPSRDQERSITLQWLATLYYLWAGHKILTSRRRFPAEISSCTPYWCIYYTSIQKPAMSISLLQSLLCCSRQDLFKIWEVYSSDPATISPATR